MLLQYQAVLVYMLLWSANNNMILIPTGGTITTSGSYTIHTFTSSGTFTTGKSGNVELLVVGGGGGGGGGFE